MEQTPDDLRKGEGANENLFIKDIIASSNGLIQLLSENERYPIVEIADKEMFLWMPEVNNKTVLPGSPESGYEHVSYTLGDAVRELLKDTGLQVFTSWDEAEAFIEKNVPGDSRSQKVKNLAYLLGLGKFGYISSRDGKHHKAGEFGYGTLCPDVMEGCDIWYSDNDADIGYYSPSNAQVVVVWRSKKLLEE